MQILAVFALVAIISTVIILWPSRRKAISEDSITKIYFATGGCFGPCPVIVLEIDSDLTYKYYGENHAIPIGSFSGKISESQWDSIRTVCQTTFKKNKDTTFDDVADDMLMTMVLSSKKQTVIIKGSESLAKGNIAKAFGLLFNSPAKVRLAKNDDSVWAWNIKPFISGPPPIPPASFEQEKNTVNQDPDDSIPISSIRIKGRSVSQPVKAITGLFGKPDSIVHFTEEMVCYYPDTVDYYIRGYVFNKVKDRDSLKFVSVDLTVPGNEISIDGLKINAITSEAAIEAKFPLAAKHKRTDTDHSGQKISGYWVYIRKTDSWLMINFKNKMAVSVSLEQDCS